jgi:hypothetical protein
MQWTTTTVIAVMAIFKVLFYPYCSFSYFNDAIGTLVFPQIEGGLGRKLSITYLIVGVQPVFTTNYGCNWIHSFNCETGY